MTNPPDAQAILSLLGGLTLGDELVGGWRLEQVHRGEVITMDLRRGEAGVTLWLRPLNTLSDAYVQTERFKLGYNNALPEGADEVLRDVERRIRVAEPKLTKATHIRLFEVQGEIDDLVLSWGALVLRVTLRCNESCPFCSAEHAGDNLVTDQERMHASIDRAAEMGATIVVLTGGEPTLVPWLPELVEHIHHVGMRCRIETNGVIPWSEVYWSRYKQLPDEIFVSFHTQHAERLQGLTGLSGTLERKISCVQFALQAGIDVILNTVATSSNLDEIADMPAYIADTFGTDVTLMFSVTAPVQRAAFNFDLVPRAGEVAPVLAQALASAHALGLRAIVPEVCGLPRCVLPSAEADFAAHEREETQQSTGEDGTVDRDRAKAPACATCVHDRSCIGVWRRYAEAYGFDEFEPVLG